MAVCLALRTRRMEVVCLSTKVCILASDAKVISLAIHCSSASSLPDSVRVQQRRGRCTKPLSLVSVQQRYLLESRPFLALVLRGHFQSIKRVHQVMQMTSKMSTCAIPQHDKKVLLVHTLIYIFFGSVDVGI